MKAQTQRLTLNAQRLNGLLVRASSCPPEGAHRPARASRFDATIVPTLYWLVSPAVATWTSQSWWHRPPAEVGDGGGEAGAAFMMKRRSWSTLTDLSPAEPAEVATVRWHADELEVRHRMVHRADSRSR